MEIVKKEVEAQRRYRLVVLLDRAIRAYCAAYAKALFVKHPSLFETILDILDSKIFDAWLLYRAEMMFDLEEVINQIMHLDAEIDIALQYEADQKRKPPVEWKPRVVKV